jgi:mono/diheme cytochrome c family protein
MVKWLTAFLISLAATLFLKSMPSAAEAAPELFRELCSVCHGVGGKGDGPSAQGLEPKPGKHAIRIRATDEKGNVQPDKVPFNQ